MITGEKIRVQRPDLDGFFNVSTLWKQDKLNAGGL